MRYVERHALWDDEQREAARRMTEQIRGRGVELVRFAWADQHGLLRGKTLVAANAIAALQTGIGVVGTLLLKDTAHRTVYPVFARGAGSAGRDFEGASDVVLVADPGTFKLLPWAANTGWVLCNAYFPDGRPVPFDTRRLYQDTLGRLAHAGYDFMAGLEVEFYLFRLEDRRLAPEDAGWPGTPPQVSLLNSGYQLLTEQRFDQLEPALDVLRRELAALDMPLHSFEVELGPSQCEIVFNPSVGIAPADTMILFRNATKQVMRRHGYHASFMCRPKIPNVMSSGWHLHQSLIERKTGRNAFMPVEGDPSGHCLSPVGRSFLGGLLAHAAGATALSTPTINGYRRYRPNSLAPDRAVWGRDNRGAMLRVIGGAGDGATRIENRVGEPAANPYLYFASQIISGLDGLAQGLDPGPSADTPYDSPATPLPRSLPQALQALADDSCLREGLGSGFVDYFVRLKQAELERFDAEVTEWEHREYFDLF